jgi:AcrR family transcriptional regulator
MSELRQRLPAARRRNQLIDVAIKCFAASGYHTTSMEEIADAAGVTKPVLYQHFGSKRALYLELLETVGEQFVSDLAERVAAETHPYRQVLVGFQAYFRFVREDTDAFNLVFDSGARQDDEFADAVRLVETNAAATVARFIEAEIDQSHRETLAYAIVGLAEVSGRRWASQATSSSPLDAEEGELLAGRLADLVFAGLRGLPGGTSR